MQEDYLADPRLMKVGFMLLKKALIDADVPKADLANASTKFALVAIAEKHNVSLASVLDSVGQKEAAKPASPPTQKVASTAADDIQAKVKAKVKEEVAAANAAAVAAKAARAVRKNNG